MFHGVKDVQERVERLFSSAFKLTFDFAINKSNIMNFTCNLYMKM